MPPSKRHIEAKGFSMKYFKLPDLGEGLQEAEIVEWLIKVGDNVKTDQIIAHLETAKAIVEIPSPQDGIIAHFFGQTGDIIHVGEPLLEYANEIEDDHGSIVGEIEASAPCTASNNIPVEQFYIGAAPGHPDKHNIAISSSVKSLAQRLNVDTNTLIASNANNRISSHDVEKAAEKNRQLGQPIPLKGVRRSMAKNMEKAHSEVVQVSLFDDADIHHWPAGEDTTLRLIQAITAACLAKPQLNSWYEGKQRSLRQLKKIDIGVAVDTPDGLFVPVMRDTDKRSFDDLKKGLENLKAAVKNRSIPAKELLNPSITLSNFGTIAGQYGTPIVVPPTVAIIGAGVITEKVVPYNGEARIRRQLPLSISFDHRCITGGEAARFLSAMKKTLSE